MLLGLATQEFLQGYFSTHVRQEKTKAAYVSDIGQFESYVGKESSLLSLTHLEIEDWVAHLKNKNYSPASIKRKVVVLKLFFSYWIRKGKLTESPFWRVEIHFGRSIQLPRALTETEMRTILRQTQKEYLSYENNRSDDPYEKQNIPTATSRRFRVLRNAAILELLFATGMRVGEVSAINISDFSVVEASIKVQGKGGKERLAFVVDKFAIKILREYSGTRQNICTTSTSLFLNASGQRLSSQGIANMIHQMTKLSGIKRHVTPHMFRHTVATLLLRNGVDIRVVQEFLGHASITTTQRYTHVSKEHMIRELQHRHPSLAFPR